jgi:hypothetical protein
MDNNSLPHTVKQQDTTTVQRRSTRIDYVTTVLLSGKDASGTPFREYTQTAIVNMHGCKVRTSYRILVGMLVSLECPKAGMSGKGVCVRVWEAAPGVAGHEIAVQLIKPQNLWGVPNPPADWEKVAKAMAQGRAGNSETPARPAAAPPPVSRAQVNAPRPPAPTPVVVSTPVAPPSAPVRVGNPPATTAATPQVPALSPPSAAPPPVAAPVRPAPVTGPTIEQRLAELERRSTQLVESVLDILRSQAEQYTRISLEEFRQQMDALIQDAEARMRQSFQRAYEESAGSLIGLRTDLMEQMASRGAQLIRSTEDTLRTRLRANGAIQDKAVAVKPPEPVAKK